LRFAAVWWHSRSSTMSPFDTVHTIFYSTLIETVRLSRTVFEILHSELLYPSPSGDSGIARSVRLSLPWCSCLGYRHAGCLQLSHRRPPEMCGLRTRPRTDVDPQRFLLSSNCRRRRHNVSPPRADTLFVESRRF